MQSNSKNESQGTSKIPSFVRDFAKKGRAGIKSKSSGYILCLVCDARGDPRTVGEGTEWENHLQAHKDNGEW